MKIKKLKLHKYKKFDDLSLDFDPGINVVVGDNEAGKSTIAQALMDLLFIDPSTKSTQFANTRKSWGTNTLPKLELDFFALQSRFSLIKDFQYKTVLFKNLDTQKSVDTHKETLDSLKKIIGINSETLYKKTAFISQGDVAFVDSSDDLLHEITDSSKIGSGQQDVQKIIKKLQVELNSLSRGLDRPANNPGPIKIQQDRIAKITDYLNDKKVQWEKRQSAANIQKSSTSELDQVKNEINLVKELLENYSIAKKGKSQRAELTNRIEELEEKIRKFEKMENEISELNEEINKFSKFKTLSLDDDVKSIVQMEQSVKLTQNELKNIDTKTDINQQDIHPVLDEQKNKFPIHLVLHVVVTLLSVVFAVLLFISRGDLIIALILIILGFSINVAILLWKKLNSSPKVDLTNKAYEDSITRINDQLETKLTGYKKEIAEILQKYGVKDVSEFYSVKANYFSIKTRIDDLSSQQRIITGGENIEKLRKIQSELILERKELDTTVLTEKVLNSVLTPEQYLVKSRELDKLEIREKKLEEELVASNTRVSDSQVEYSDILILKEELENAKIYLSDLIKKQKILQLTVTTLQEAILEVSKSANKVLEKAVIEKLSKITANRYTRLKVRPDLSIQVHSEDKNEWVDPVTELSRGTIDQIYFLVRLGYLKLITENKSLPIILDDPFVTSDATRKEAIHEIIDEISKQFQVILFTNDYDYANWGNSIILPSTP